MNALFISDLHLEEKRPDITRAFLRFLSERAGDADALYILGDFFEVWIGDDGAGPFEQRIATALRELAERGTAVFLMHGNRDFLLGRRFCREAGCRLLAEGSVVEINGERILLAHGDSYCTRDEKYQQFRRRLRNPFSRWLLRHLPLNTRRRLARKLRMESQLRGREKPADIVDVTPEVIDLAMSQSRVRTLIHGHTHRPAIHSLTIDGQPARRIVLGDWDTQGWVVIVDENGQRLESFALET